LHHCLAKYAAALTGTTSSELKTFYCLGIRDSLAEGDDGELHFLWVSVHERADDLACVFQQRVGGARAVVDREGLAPIWEKVRRIIIWLGVTALEAYCAIRPEAAFICKVEFLTYLAHKDGHRRDCRYVWLRKRE
jgi:hypothetical protein